MSQSTRFLGPAVDLSTDGGSRAAKKRGSRTVVPLLPSQQSLAERVAQRKNRVLQKRLQYSLDSITRDRRSYLSGVHIEASRFRRRANDLTDLLPRGEPHATPTSDHLPSSCPSATPTHVTPHGTRPSTSMDVGRRVGGTVVWRPKTAGHPHPTIRHKDKAHEKPLFRVRDNKVKTASSDEDSDDSEDDSMTYSSDDSGGSEYGAVRNGTIPSRGLPSHAAGSPGFKNGGNKTRLMQTPQRTLPPGAKLHSRQDRTTKNDRRQMKPRFHKQRCVSSLGRFTSPVQTTEKGLKSDKDSSSRRRAQTAVVRPGNARRATVATPLGQGDPGSARDASYIQLVLAMERDQYELSQKKVRSYLQNLKI